MAPGDLLVLVPGQLSLGPGVRISEPTVTGWIEYNSIRINGLAVSSARGAVLAIECSTAARSVAPMAGLRGPAHRSSMGALDGPVEDRSGCIRRLELTRTVRGGVTTQSSRQSRSPEVVSPALRAWLQAPGRGRPRPLKVVFSSLAGLTSQRPGRRGTRKRAV